MPRSQAPTSCSRWQPTRRSKASSARKDGDVAKGLESAAKKIEAVYELPFLAHAAMEPMNCTVHVREDGCDIWVGTQVVSRAQATAAQVTGLPPEKIQVHNHLIGGGFGRRLDVDGITQAVAIAKQVDGPVKIVWSREEDIQHDVYRPYYYDRLAAGLDAQGMPVAWTPPRHRLLDRGALASSGLQGWPRFRRGRGRGERNALCNSQHSCRLGPQRASCRPHDWMVARCRTHAQYLRGRELHRRAGGGGEEGSGGISPRLARQIAARAWRARISRRRRPAGARRCRKASGAACRCNSPWAPICRKSPMSKCPRMATSWFGAWFARWIAGTSSTPTRSWRRSRAASSSASVPRYGAR